MAVLAAFSPRFGGLDAVVGEVAPGRLAAFSPGLRGLLTIVGKITRIFVGGCHDGSPISTNEMAPGISDGQLIRCASMFNR